MVKLDEDVQITFYADADDDGFGNADITTLACEAPSGFVQQGTDCDDLDDTSYPGAPEICDEIDNNCNSEIDEDQKNIFISIKMVMDLVLRTIPSKHVICELD